MNFRNKLFSVMIIAILGLIISCGKNAIKEIKTEELLKNIDNSSYVIIDTRRDSLYNGFKDKNAKRGGHIKNAIQFTAAWLNYIEDAKFETYAAGKGITKDKTLVIYDTDNESLNSVAGEFAARGYKVKTYKDFVNYANDEDK